ncbi:MAG: hypothetical protein HXY19_07620 [Thermoanaerobaculaceae bacterium]|nr:hypothetical protein [Thermoanaerobaculaceae bacterium]
MSQEEDGVVAVLVPAALLAPDTYTLTVSDEVVDAASGQRLDGEMGVPAAFPSGDGVPGGRAVVTFEVVRDLRRRLPVGSGQ